MSWGRLQVARSTAGSIMAVRYEFIYARVVVGHWLRYRRPSFRALGKRLLGPTTRNSAILPTDITEYLWDRRESHLTLPLQDLVSDGGPMSPHSGCYPGHGDGPYSPRPARRVPPPT